MQSKRALMHRFKWFSAAVAGFVICIFAQGCALQSEEFKGTWVVTEAIQPGIAAMRNNAADDHLGLSLTYREDQAQLGQRHCASPHYGTRLLKPSEISQRYQVPADSLFVKPDAVKSVQVTCESTGSPFGETMFLQPGGIAYTVSDGIFFKLEKASVKAS